MIEVVVLDRDLQPINLIDNYESVLWINRFIDIGECELYLSASEKALQTLVKGNYLARVDDDMVCRIESIEIDTDVENGNHLIVKGYDAKKILDQRVIWSTINNDGKVEDYIRNIVQKSVCNPNLNARQIKNSQGQQMMYLGTPAGFSEVITEQVSYKNVGEKIRELCSKYNWGYKVIADSSKLWFVLYKGSDKSNYVIFSNDYENLKSSRYLTDSTNIKNVALVAGVGEGSDRSRNVSGYAEGIDRFEVFVDAKDISKTITWEDLTLMYPTTSQGGHGHISDTAQGVFYVMDIVNIAIVDSNQLTELQANYPNGQIVTIGGEHYYQIYNVVIADLPNSSPDSDTSVILRPVIYEVFLLNRGYEKLSEYVQTVTFEGSVEPDVTFSYKKDYNLGDEVLVRNEYGIEAKARIVEVLESEDSNGYNLEPRFEY